MYDDPGIWHNCRARDTWRECETNNITLYDGGHHGWRMRCWCGEECGTMNESALFFIIDHNDPRHREHAA